MRENQCTIVDSKTLDFLTGLDNTPVFAPLRSSGTCEINSHVIVRTTRFLNSGPVEDISVSLDLGSGRYAMLLGDFTGPDTTKNLSMISLKKRVPALLRESEQPSFALENLNTELIASNGMVDYVTAVALFADIRKKIITWATAGHLGPLYRRWGSQRWSMLDCGGIPLGIKPKERYITGIKRLVTGDKILLISDGILKSCGISGRLIELNSLFGELDQLPSDGAPTEIMEGIDEIVGHFTRGTAVRDEITVMLVQV